MQESKLKQNYHAEIGSGQQFGCYQRNGSTVDVVNDGYVDMSKEP